MIDNENNSNSNNDNDIHVNKTEDFDLFEEQRMLNLF